MKGSDKWGQGGGPRIRIELVLIALLAATAVGAYFYVIQSDQLTSVGQSEGVTSVTTTGTSCDDPSLPQAAQAIEQSSNFTALSGGVCYNLRAETQSAAAPSATFYFDYYNGTIAYPCGTAPQEVAASEIVVVADGATGKISSVQAGDPSSINHTPPCAHLAPLSVVSVADVQSTIPAVPQLNLTLGVNSGTRPVATLTAKLTLDGGVQTFRFSIPTSKLQQGQAASSTEIVLGSVTFSSHEAYPLAVSGTFDDGATFSFQAYVQIADVP